MAEGINLSLKKKLNGSGAGQKPLSTVKPLKKLRIITLLKLRRSKNFGPITCIRKQLFKHCLLTSKTRLIIHYRPSPTILRNKISLNRFLDDIFRFSLRVWNLKLGQRKVLYRGVGTKMVRTGNSLEPTLL